MRFNWFTMVFGFFTPGTEIWWEMETSFSTSNLPIPPTPRQSGARYLLRTSAEDRLEKRDPQRDVTKGFPCPSCNPKPSSFSRAKLWAYGPKRTNTVPHCLSFPQRILQTLQTSIHSYRLEVVYEHLSFRLPTRIPHLLRDQMNTITTRDCWCLQSNVWIRKNMGESTWSLQNFCKEGPSLRTSGRANINV